MNSIYRAFGKHIEITYEHDHTPKFNGRDTPHEALIDCNEIYRGLPFAEQMAICSTVMLDLLPLPEQEAFPDSPLYDTSTVPGRLFIYTYEWYITEQDYACIVFDAGTGNLVFDEWFSVLKQHGVMDEVGDVKNLFVYLLRQGEILEGDVLRHQELDNSDDDKLQS